MAALFDQNGASVETYRYTGFGIETTPTSVINPWRYASKRFDPETGFIYFGRRYYARAIGRWVTTDPEGYQDGPNLYAYVHNNPLSKYDLYGLFEEAGWFSSYDDFKSHAKRSFFNTLSSPYFQGSLQAIGGICEASLGCTAAIGTGFLGAPIGMLAVAHGLDHLNAGISTIVSGSPRETFTTQLLQKTGMSDPWARSIDSGASMMLSMSAAMATQSTRVASYQSFSLSTTSNLLKRNPSKLLIETEEVGCFF